MSYLVKKTSTDGFRVRFFDYDGTLLSTQYIASGEDAQAPAIPAHSRLIFSEWNRGFTNILYDIDVGALYKTASGSTELDVTVTAATGLDLTLNIKKLDNQSMTIDWGDGHITTKTTTGNISIIHSYAYAGAGDYTIKISSIPHFDLGQGTSLTPVIDNNYQLRRAYLGDCNLVQCSFYEQCSMTEISLHTNVPKSAGYVFFSCKSLYAIVLPSNFLVKECDFQADYMLTIFILHGAMGSIGKSAFQSCSSLKSIIDSGGGAISANAFYSCSAIEKIFIMSATSIPTSCCNSCLCLRSFVVYASLISIGDSAFNNCLSLTYLSFPSTLTSIAALAFNACTEMMEYHFKSTTPPTLAGTNAFTGINQICKIYVPTASVAAYKAAANWSTYSNYIFGE